jgi:type II secretory pathway component PulJ
MSNDTKQQNGHALAEVMVAVAVFLIVLATAFRLIGQSTNVGKSQQALAFSQNNLRNVVTIMSKDVQLAGFFDTLQTTRTSPTVAFTAIPAASATSTSFQLVTQQWNGAADVSQTVTYAYNASKKQLTRNNVTLLTNATPIDSNTPIFSYTADPNDATAKIGVTIQLQADTGQKDPYTMQPISRQISTTILSRNGKYASDRLTITPAGSGGSGGTTTDFSKVPTATN